MKRLLIASLFAAMPLGAPITDRVPAVVPSGNIVNAEGARVVAGDDGMYLAGGHRVTAGGVLVDREPLPGVDGPAAPWQDGWLVVSAHDGRLHVRHLRATGEPEIVMVIPGTGRLQGIASASDRLAILEFTGSGLRLTISDGRDVLRQEFLGLGAEHARIARYRDGFLVVAWMGSPRVLTAYRFDAGGTLLVTRAIEVAASGSTGVDAISVDDGHALVLTIEYPMRSYRVLDEDMEPTPPASFDGRPPGFSWGTPLPIEGGFLVSYAQSGEHRARVVRHDGEVVGDEPSHLISGGDRSGNRYLVVRPWGHAAIAEGDPRTIISPPVQLKRRVFEQWDRLRTVVSDDVTMVRFGRFGVIDRFVRIERDGTAIDPVPLPIPGTFTWNHATFATPDGFGFAWPEGDSVMVQRLGRRGGWIDSKPVAFPILPEWRGFAVHENGNDLLLAWATRHEMFWRRFSHAGEAIDLLPWRVSQATSGLYGLYSAGVSIVGNGEDRLVALLEEAVCQITCIPVDPAPFIVEVFSIGRHGGAFDAPRPIGGRGHGALALSDGTWVIPMRSQTGEVLRVSVDGRLLERISMPGLSGELRDVAPTSSGWKAIVDFPHRLIELEGAARAVRLTGLQPDFPVHFTAGERLAFIEQSTVLEGVAVPWTGRLTTQEGDVAVRLTDLGVSVDTHPVEVTVWNKGPREVTNLIVASSHQTVGVYTIPVLKPGAVHRFQIAVPHGSTVFVLSPNLTDVSPADNWMIPADARRQRQRPVRP